VAAADPKDFASQINVAIGLNKLGDKLGNSNFPNLGATKEALDNYRNRPRTER
jgi:hypothetical protein